jgi:hypothetical protein
MTPQLLNALTSVLPLPDEQMLLVLRLTSF